MSLRALPILLVTGILLVGAAYASAFLPGGAPTWAPWSFVLGIATSFVAFLVLGAGRKGRIGWLAWPFGFLFVALVASLGAGLLLPPADPGDPALLLGLPLPAAVVILGAGFLPLLLLPLAYALDFGRDGLSPAEVARIRDAARRAREEETAAGGADAGRGRAGGTRAAGRAGGGR